MAAIAPSTSTLAEPIDGKMCGQCCLLTLEAVTCALAIACIVWGAMYLKTPSPAVYKASLSCVVVGSLILVTMSGSGFYKLLQGAADAMEARNEAIRQEALIDTRARIAARGNENESDRIKRIAKQVLLFSVAITGIVLGSIYIHSSMRALCITSIVIGTLMIMGSDSSQRFRDWVDDNMDKVKQ